jgi:hypothetical protein
MNFSSTCFSFCDSNCNKKEYALCRGSTFLYNFIPFWSVKQLLVLFAWEEIFSQSIRVSPFLSRLLIPFLVLVIILFLLDLAGNQYNIHFLSFSFIFDFILTNWTLFCFVLFWSGGITRTLGLTRVFPIIVAINSAFYASKNQKKLHIHGTKFLSCQILIESQHSCDCGIDCVDFRCCWSCLQIH